MFQQLLLFIAIFILLIFLGYSKTYKEGFLSSTHNTYVSDSQDKFNPLTNTLNLTNPILPLTKTTQDNINIAINTNIPVSSSTSGYDIKSSIPYKIPSSGSSTYITATTCEAKGLDCNAFDDPIFAQNCGMSFWTQEEAKFIFELAGWKVRDIIQWETDFWVVAE